MAERKKVQKIKKYRHKERQKKRDKTKQKTFT